MDFLQSIIFIKCVGTYTWTYTVKLLGSFTVLDNFNVCWCFLGITDLAGNT